MAASARVGVDIGGTFTDIVVRRPGERSLIMKVLVSSTEPRSLPMRCSSARGRGSAY
ncbi:hypothetical protein EBZ80_24765 [bacterium]|nr:hypothetical protein [bacterium]